MDKKTIAYVVYAIGGIWALYVCTWDDHYWVGIQFAIAFFIAAVFGIVGSIILFSSNEKKKDEKNIGLADKLLEYKKLLDAGVITQEEFEKKKKEILGQEKI